MTGAALKDETMEVKAGDTVFYRKYAGTELHIDGTDYLLLSQVMFSTSLNFLNLF
jgi:chaperonin GroES